MSVGCGMEGWGGKCVLKEERLGVMCVRVGLEGCVIGRGRSKSGGREGWVVVDDDEGVAAIALKCGATLVVDDFLDGESRMSP